MKKNNKNFNTFQEAQKVLGEDFWDVLSDAYPMIGPRADIIQSQNEMMIFMDVPGIQNRKDIKISVQNNYLLINGEIPDLNFPGFEFLQQERFYGSFNKKIRLPTSAVYEQLRAFYRHGILQIIIPLTGNDHDEEMDFPIDFIYD